MPHDCPHCWNGDAVCHMVLELNALELGLRWLHDRASLEPRAQGYIEGYRKAFEVLRESNEFMADLAQKRIR